MSEASVTKIGNLLDEMVDIIGGGGNRTTASISTKLSTANVENFEEMQETKASVPQFVFIGFSHVPGLNEVHSFPEFVCTAHKYEAFDAGLILKHQQYITQIHLESFRYLNFDRFDLELMDNCQIFIGGKCIITVNLPYLHSSKWIRDHIPELIIIVHFVLQELHIRRIHINSHCVWMEGFMIMPLRDFLHHHVNRGL